MPWPLLILFSLPWLASPQNLVKVKLFRNLQGHPFSQIQTEPNFSAVMFCSQNYTLICDSKKYMMTLHIFLFSLRSPSRPHLLVLISWVRSSPPPSPLELATPPSSTLQSSMMQTPWTLASRLVAQPLPAVRPSSKLEPTAPCVGGPPAWKTGFACRPPNSRKRAMG